MCVLQIYIETGPKRQSPSYDRPVGLPARAKSYPGVYKPPTPQTSSVKPYTVQQTIYKVYIPSCLLLVYIAGQCQPRNSATCIQCGLLTIDKVIFIATSRSCQHNSQVIKINYNLGAFLIDCKCSRHIPSSAFTVISSDMFLVSQIKRSSAAYESTGRILRGFLVFWSRIPQLYIQYSNGHPNPRARFLSLAAILMTVVMRTM